MTDAEAQRCMMQDEDYLEFLPSGLLVPHYLIHCYLYYKLASPIIPDQTFDQLARRLRDEWAEAEHPNRKLIDRKALSSGGYYLTYPLRVQKSAESLLK